MSRVELDIIGTPAPQGSKTAVSRGGRAWLIEGSSKEGRQKHQAWRNACEAAALKHRGRIDPEAPVEVEVVFRMPLPKSYANWRAGTDCYVKPDLDKLIRSTLDGLSDGELLAGGDSRVCWVQASKRYVEDGEQPGAWVVVHGVDVPQRTDVA